ncbi:bifunctional GTP diphosphokinase/guanosine-3',5'-bis pyrophosphate 3'-pyrophosphohydrolase [Natronospira bacteriovora]|uniref:guanosine-3',5'-bis(diphosphate) 3'-diphosphatase n=1 Tax=Natronospira bacteriovora TaxID=3069753 RepID=A0ABU0W829_9GAMM|nr:bifunctional GTP diphosphokinase/guanosine-3',5'-bis pyrophosphate 3'-pyrophosphohydrolase [Natronospira sp. AB-CW4]MDQ2070190.1 bifunctional GTP diphosphokinase/guanosine-3',5'-bis pyrophosphate 3'-pyrophosphohydrolase [Natronospira sp. AB-CW4]
MNEPAAKYSWSRRARRAVGIDGLLAQLREYLPDEQVQAVDHAFQFGAHAHEGQRRLTGEPYISHPVAVAGILAELRMDYKTLIAAILHDVIEDTPTAKDDIADRFGEDVAQLVDGVSKLTQIRFRSKAEAQAENFRKMLLAMVEDIRVILVKLADRLHNMRTLGVMPPAKRRRIASETLEIYAPIAGRLGINSIRLELEDLGFKSMHPTRYRVISRHLRKVRGNQRQIFRHINQAFGEALSQEGIDARVESREKHLYSIYRKMLKKRLSLADVLDVYGFRITVDKVDTCYRVLGIVHGVYKPVPGRFKDYVAIPKANGYQSLHTTLFGPHGVPIEVQIRTHDMNRIAESGIAAHWIYKDSEKEGRGSTAREGSGPEEIRAREWLKGVLEMQKGSGSSMEFLENVKVDLFPDEVYVFTPDGDIRRLPRGATAVDFAYAVHTGVGNACVAAKINRRLAPLRTRLVNGQTVEIITADNARPNPAWLNFVVTAKARAAIRHYLKNLHQEDAVEMGRRLLERSLAEMELKLRKIPSARIDALLEEFQLDSREDLFEQIGLGKRMAPIVARRLAPELEGDESGIGSSTPLTISGTEGMVVNLARCCYPIPGDPIVGYLSQGRGIVVHREDCSNLHEYSDEPDKWIDIQWEKDLSRDFSVAVKVDVENKRGVLASVAATMSEEGSNIEHVNVQERDGDYTTLHFVFNVQNRRHLADIMRSIRSMPEVLKIVRTHS